MSCSSLGRIRLPTWVVSMRRVLVFMAQIRQLAGTSRGYEKKNPPAATTAGRAGRTGAAMIIDIHPHVISTDIAKYPRAPIGGHQSDWSRERPVSVEQMIVAMDKAGIGKSAL